MISAESEENDEEEGKNKLHTIIANLFIKINPADNDLDGKEISLIFSIS